MAKKNPQYTKSTTTKIKANGTLNLKKGTIDTGEKEIKLSTLFADFDGTIVELSMQIKEDEEFDAPEDEI